MRSSIADPAGFTLMEIIVTLTVAAIVSVMLVQFMGTSISRSTEPTVSMQEGMRLQGVLENMNADYKLLLLTHKTPLDEFKKRVETDGFYGTYTLSESAYIRFDESHDESACTSADCRILKVTISSGDHSLTSLFAR
jgi:prepilin-type N-terminal cleavage/methylation domain-containing protein